MVSLQFTEVFCRFCKKNGNIIMHQVFHKKEKKKQTKRKTRAVFHNWKNIVLPSGEFGNIFQAKHTFLQFSGNYLDFSRLVEETSRTSCLLWRNISLARLENSEYLTNCAAPPSSSDCDRCFPDFPQLPHQV